MTSDEFRKYGHMLIDWIADYRDALPTHAVMSKVRPGEMRASLPKSAPIEAVPPDSLLADFDKLLMPGITHWQHPRFFGYFPANAPLSSVLGDILCSGLGVLGLNWQASPALTELEELTTDWVRQMVGLSDNWAGVIQDSASASNLVALICARERTTQFSLVRGGLQAEPKPLVVYLSEQSHSSVEKAALLAGFGRANIRFVPTDRQYAMRADRLEEMVNADIQAGAIPCAVVSTTGSTASTAMDPISEIARVAKRHQLWHHVDAAMAGSAMILPECRQYWQGIEFADSLVFNPHKWLGAAFDCSLYYVQDSQFLTNVMSTNPSYLQTTADSQTRNYRDWGIPLGRRFRALKLWSLIRSEGVSGLQARLRRDRSNAAWLSQQVNSSPNWRVVAPVPIQTVCVRHEPEGRTIEELDAHNQKWAERLNQSGEAYLTPTLLGGRWVVRVSIGNFTTERSDIAALWVAMQREASAFEPDKTMDRVD
jgi:aromatic-L-amino-acid/L-tryptophan decarboxylase